MEITVAPSGGLSGDRPFKLTARWIIFLRKLYYLGYEVVSNFNGRGIEVYIRSETDIVFLGSIKVAGTFEVLRYGVEILMDLPLQTGVGVSIYEEKNYRRTVLIDDGEAKVYNGLSAVSVASRDEVLDRAYVC